jgi:two-component system cell cycle response regulator
LTAGAAALTCWPQPPVGIAGATSAAAGSVAAWTGYLLESLRSEMTARILVVDDVPSNLRLLEAKLTADYYQVATAPDGFAALREAVAWQPDLILLDVMMPGMDGYETCRRLKHDPATQHIPVVMVTALGEPEERVAGLEAGADDFLTKPVEFDTLMARVSSLVRLKRLLDEWRARGDTARALGLSADAETIPSIAGARALVVDDWDHGAARVQGALGKDGVIVARARDEVEAMQLCNSLPFDLIVLNLSIASNDPLRFAARLRAADETHQIPLLLIAEPDQRDRVLRGFALGANDWLLQPLDENELRARARNQIRRKYYQDRLRADLGHALEMALTDPLTGLYNQRYLARHLAGLLAPPAPRALAVLMIDVDHFKQINDRFGHPAGDRALKLIADTLRARTRVFDTVARYGGEEFVVVMPGSDEAEARAVAERLRVAVEEIAFEPEPRLAHRLGVSIGIACRPAGAEGVSADSLVNAADRALYLAKQAGRNRVVMAE